MNILKISSQELLIKVDNNYDSDSALKLISDDVKMISQIKNIMPLDYDLIINQEKYNQLLAHGTPQLTICGWTITSIVDNYGITISIKDFK